MSDPEEIRLSPTERSVATNAVAYAWISTVHPDRVFEKNGNSVIDVSEDERKAASKAVERLVQHLNRYREGKS